MMLAQKKKFMNELVNDEIDKRVLEHARSEREKMEKELKAEIERVVRETSVANPKNEVLLNLDDGPLPSEINLKIQKMETPPPELESVNSPKHKSV
jgi:uncharacterized protein YllA (UPF0747 family)